MQTEHEDTELDPAEAADILASAARDLALPIQERFGVTDEKQANWVVRKVVESRQYRERVKAWAELETRRAEADEKRLMYIFGAQLQAWVDVQIASSGSRRKSVALPAGQVGYRHQNTKLVIVDDKAVIEWARIHCAEAIRVVESLLKHVLNDRFKTTGEIPEIGVRVEPPNERFYVK